MKKSTIEYVTAYLMREMSKRKEKANVMMLQWCCLKVNGTINFHVKTSRRASIMANWSTSHIFATKQRIIIKRILTIPKKMITTHLQCNMEHTDGHVNKS